MLREKERILPVIIFLQGEFISERMRPRCRRQSNFSSEEEEEQRKRAHAVGFPDLLNLFEEKAAAGHLGMI